MTKRGGGINTGTTQQSDKIDRKPTHFLKVLRLANSKLIISSLCHEFRQIKYVSCHNKVPCFKAAVHTLT